MADTTKANVLLIAPQFSAVDDTVWDLILADVKRQVSISIYQDCEEEAQRYLAAHLLSLIDVENTSGVSGTIAGPIIEIENRHVSIKGGTLADLIPANKATRYDLTVYGQRFMQLTNQHNVYVGVY